MVDTRGNLAVLVSCMVELSCVSSLLFRLTCMIVTTGSAKNVLTRFTFAACVGCLAFSWAWATCCVASCVLSVGCISSFLDFILGGRCFWLVVVGILYMLPLRFGWVFVCWVGVVFCLCVGESSWTVCSIRSMICSEVALIDSPI